MDHSERSQRERRFVELYEREHADIVRFIARRCVPPGVTRAEDIAHDAFVVAWRRLDEVPSDRGEARAYLFAVARNCLLNDQRTVVRQGAIQVRIASVADGAMPGFDDRITHLVDLAAAWHGLAPPEQEVIALTAWDGLTSEQAGRVLGISGPAYRRRLFRARASLRRAVEPGSARASRAAAGVAPQPAESHVKESPA